MAVTHTIYDNFIENLFLGDMGALDADTLKLALAASGYTFSEANDDAFADVTNELSTANGYTAGGATLASVTVVLSSGTVTLDANDVQWTASGGSIVFRRGVLYNDTPTTPTADPLISSVLGDDSPADITTTDGNTLTFQWNASGIITAS